MNKVLSSRRFLHFPGTAAFATRKRQRRSFQESRCPWLRRGQRQTSPNRSTERHTEANRGAERRKEGAGKDLAAWHLQHLLPCSLAGNFPRASPPRHLCAPPRSSALLFVRSAPPTWCECVCTPRTRPRRRTLGLHVRVRVPVHDIRWEHDMLPRLESMHAAGRLHAPRETCI